MANKELDRGLKGLGNQLMGAVKQAASVRVRVSCKHCGGYKGLIDSSPCPHPGAHDGEQYEHDVTITTVASPEPQKPWISRLDKKKEEGEPIRLNPKITPEKEAAPSLTNARVRTDGGTTRAIRAGLRGPENDPFIQAQEANIIDYEPNVRTGLKGDDDLLDRLTEEPDVPIYGLDPRG